MQRFKMGDIAVVVCGVDDLVCGQLVEVFRFWGLVNGNSYPYEVRWRRRGGCEYNRFFNAEQMEKLKRL